MNTDVEPKIGDLRVWWIPQLGIKNPFFVDVSSIDEAAKLVDVLARYDIFQLENKVKPDFCNVGGLQIFVEDDGRGDAKPGWVDWYDEDTGENLDEYVENRKVNY